MSSNEGNFRSPFNLKLSAYTCYYTSNLYISRSEKLGEGAFGVVYKGKYDGRPVAVKIIKNADVELAFIEEFGKEVEALA